MSTAILDMFQMSAPTKAERDLDSDRDDPVKVLRAVNNALLAMDAAATEAQSATKRAAKIASRLDDPAMVGTPKQRGEAEAAHFGLTYRAKSIIREEIPRQARVLLKLWPKLLSDDREWFQTSFVAGWNTSPLWSVLDKDPVLSKDKVIADLIRRANRAKPERAPF